MSGKYPLAVVNGGPGPIPGHSGVPTIYWQAGSIIFPLPDHTIVTAVAYLELFGRFGGLLFQTTAKVRSNRLTISLHEAMK